MSERRELRDRAKIERQIAERGAPPGRWLTAQLLPYFTTLLFLGGLGWINGQNPGIGVGMLATGLFWGARIAKNYLTYQEVYAKRGASSGATIAANPAPPALTAETRALPETVADLPELLSRVETWLRSQDQTVTADRLRAGWEEVLRLAQAEAAAHLGATEEAELRAEFVRLTGKAEAAQGAEARQLWIDNAQAATRRLEKLKQLAATLDHTHARIEAYRQLLKTLAVDLTRLGLADSAELADRAQQVAREVDLLVQARSELSAHGVEFADDAKRATAQRMTQRQGG